MGRDHVFATARLLHDRLGLVGRGSLDQGVAIHTVSVAAVVTGSVRLVLD